MADLRYLHEVFGQGGILSRVKPDYAPRAAQITMAHLVERAFSRQEQVVIEAPTGVGKSFAYLAPAIWHAYEHKRKTLVVTDNKKMQRQLFERDLPALWDAVHQKWYFGYELAIGKSNYLCNDKLAEGWDGLDEHLRDWALNTEAGQFSELAPDIVRDAKRKLSVTHEQCHGAQCPFMPKKDYDAEEFRRESLKEDLLSMGIDHPEMEFPDACFPKLARQRWLEDADIIVANYALLIAHLRVQQLTEGIVNILPPFTALICDEAHNLADRARDQLGEQLTFKGLMSIDGSRRYQDAVRNFFGALHALRNRYVAERDHLWLVDTLTLAEGNRLRHALEEIVARSASDAYQAQQAALFGGRKKRGSLKKQRKHKMAKNALGKLDLLTSDDKDDRIVRFIDPDVNLGCKVIDVSGFLAHAWQTPTVVMTSATLTVNDSFDYLDRETGLALAQQDTAVLDSPFDYEQNSLLFVDRHLADPSSDRGGWEAQACKRIRQLLIANGGRALCLFTSRKMMDRTFAMLTAESARAAARGDLNFAIYKQGEDTSTNQHLFEQFCEHRTSVLLGLASFREGADAPGDTCTLVIIDKIPFPTPSDPVMQALEQRTSNVFNAHMVPRAAIHMKQAIGRLIRRTTDKGVVAILDPRLATRRYGKTLLASRPKGMPVTTDVKVAMERMKNGTPH